MLKHDQPPNCSPLPLPSGRASAFLAIGRAAGNFALTLWAAAHHIGVVTEDPHFAFKVEADPLREGRYRWTICEGIQIHLRSPVSYATRREAEEDADKAMSRFVCHRRNRDHDRQGR